MYNSDSSYSDYRTAYNSNGYGGMAYYSSATCGYSNNQLQTSGCTTDYAQSEIKYVVDAWKSAQAPQASSARLITINDLVDNLGYEYNEGTTSIWYTRSDDTPNWVYNSSYTYWTMDSCANNSQNVYVVGINNILGSDTIVSSDYEVLRPVITIKKSALQS